MKGGHTPIHIMRFAPADYVDDPFVRGLYQRRDFRTAAFYPLFLFYSFMEGGSLPLDVSTDGGASPLRVSTIASLVLMREADVRHAIETCLHANKIVRKGGRLFHRRVRREILSELKFRRQQAGLGKLGGLARAARLAQGKPKASSSPPSPSPSPVPASAPAPSPAPSPSRGNGPPASRPDSARKNPFVGAKRDDYEREALRLTGDIGTLTGEDGAEIFARAAHYEGALRQKVNPSNLTDDRLLNTVLDLRATLKAEREKRAGSG